MKVLRSILAAAVCIAVLAHFGASAPAGEIEAAVPEEAFLLVKLADWSKTMKDIAATAPGRIAAEQGVADCAAAALQAWEKLAAAIEKQGGVKRDDLRRAFGGELAVFMPGLSKHDLGDETDAPAFALAGVARVTDPEAAGRVMPVLEQMLRKSAEDQGKTVREVQFGAVKAVRMGPEDVDPENASVFLFRAGAWQALVLSNSEAKVKQLAADLAAGGCARPLTGSADFRQCRAALGARADLLWYFGTKKLTDQLLERLPEEIREKAGGMLTALKLADMPATAGSVAVEGAGFRSRTFVGWKPGPDGLPGLVDGTPLTGDFLKVAPAGTVMMLAGRFRFDRVIPLCREVARAAGAPEDFDAEVLAEANEELGFDVEKDLAAKLGSQVCVLVLSPQSVGGNPLLGEINGLVAAVEVRDAAAVRAVVAKVAELVRKEKEAAAEDEAEEGGGAAAKAVNEFDYRGVKVTTFAAGGMVTPAVAVTDRLLLVAPNVQAVKKLLSGLPAGAEAGGATLVDSDAFKKAVAAAGCDPSKACGVSYVDTAALAGGLLPKVSLISGLLSTFGDLGAPRAGVVSKNNMRQIGLACHMWADDNDEVFPGGLLTLVPDYIDNKRILLCPDYARHAADGVDYAFVAGLKVTDRGETILAYETVARPDGTVNVLHVDAHVAAVKSEDLKKRLETQAAKFKEDKREVKIVEPQGVGRAAPGEAAEDVEALAAEFGSQAVKAAAGVPTEAVTRHLFAGVAATRPVEGGILVDGFGPLGFVPHLGNLLGGAGAGGMMAPWFFMMGMRGAAMDDIDIDDLDDLDDLDDADDDDDDDDDAEDDEDDDEDVDGNGAVGKGAGAVPVRPLPAKPVPAPVPDPGE